MIKFISVSTGKGKEKKRLLLPLDTIEYIVEVDGKREIGYRDNGKCGDINETFDQIQKQVMS